MRTFHLFAFCGLVTIFLLSLSVTTAEDENQEEYDDDDDENVNEDQVIDPQTCPRNQLFGRAACDRICNYNEKEKAMDSTRASLDSVWSKPTTCRQSDEFDETFCSCPNDKDGGLDLTICRKAGEEDENKEAVLTSEEVSHCNSLCSREGKIAYSCQIRIEWEYVAVCACGGRVNLQLLESRERKKRWATMVRRKRAEKAQTNSSNPDPERADLDNYLNTCIKVAESLDTSIKGLTADLDNITKTLKTSKAELDKTK